MTLVYLHIPMLHNVDVHHAGRGKYIYVYIYNPMDAMGRIGANNRKSRNPKTCRSVRPTLRVRPFGEYRCGEAARF